MRACSGSAIPMAWFVKARVMPESAPVRIQPNQASKPSATFSDRDSNPILRKTGSSPGYPSAIRSMKGNLKTSAARSPFLMPCARPAAMSMPAATPLAVLPNFCPSAVVSKAMTLVYDKDAAKWFPSY